MTFKYVFHTYFSNALSTYHTRNKNGETNLKVEVQIICKRIVLLTLNISNISRSDGIIFSLW